MIQRVKSMSQLNEEARQLLIRELGVGDAIRFFGQFDTGSGNYATDRDQWQAGLTVEQIASDIKEWKAKQGAEQS
jgi:hypothetical protein